MKRTALIILFVFVSIVLILTASRSTAAEKPIIFGVASCQTGVLQVHDLAQKRTLEFFAEDVNKKGGIMGRPVKVVVADTKCDPKLGLTAALDVIEKGAIMVQVSSDYDFSAPSAFAANDREVIAFSPAGASTKIGVQGIGPFAFTMSHGTPTEGAAMAEFGFREKGWRNAYVLLDTSIDYDKKIAYYFKKRWKSLGGKIVGEDTFLQGTDASIPSQITRMKSLSKKPDVVMISTWFSGFGMALRQMRAAGIDWPVLGNEAADGLFWVDAVPNLSNFFYVTNGSLFGNDFRPEFNKMVKRYEKKYGEKPPLSSFQSGYCVGQAMAEAIKRAGGKTDGKSLKKALESFKDVPVLVGKITYTDKVHMCLGRALAALEIQNGKHKYLKQVIVEKIPPIPDFK